jgi:hypothetical protein
MVAVSNLLRRIERHCAAAAIAETTFGRHAVNDGKLVARLRAGRSITIKTLRRIEAALAQSPTGDRRPTGAGGEGSAPR